MNAIMKQMLMDLRTDLDMYAQHAGDIGEPVVTLEHIHAAIHRAITSGVDNKQEDISNDQ
jgi:hypothetical protein